MNLLFSLLLVCLYSNFVQADTCSKPSASNSNKPTDYPVVHASNTAFSYRSAKAKGNVTVPDPYHWLEADINESKELKNFIEEQMNRTKSYLKANKDFNTIRSSIGKLNQFIGLEQPTAFGPLNNRLYLYNILQPNDARPIWYIATESEMQEAYKTKFDPLPGKAWFNENLLSADGTQTIKEFDPSPNGDHMAYVFNDGGDDTFTIYVRNTSSPFLKPGKEVGGSGRLPNDVLPFEDGSSVLWLNDTAFIYNQQKREDEGFGSRVRFHRLGDNPENNITVIDIAKDDGHSYWGSTISTDRKWLLVIKYKAVDFHKAIYVASLDQPISNDMKWQSIAPELDAQMYFLANINNTFYFATDKNAPNIRVISVQVDPGKAKSASQLSDLKDQLEYKTVIPEKLDAQMDLLSMDGWSPVFETNKLLTYYVHNAKHVLYLFDLITGEELMQVLPNQNDTIITFKTDQFDKEYFLSTTSMNNPKTIYRITLSDGKLHTELIYRTKVDGVDLKSIASEQRWAVSKDGTKIPFYLFYRKGQTFDGTSPVWIFSYGQYGYNTLPTYVPQFLDWILAYDGVIFWGNPRGGGELGAKWHDGGKNEKRQNIIDDVISFAQYAVEHKISAPGKTVVNGGSAAGTTTMAVINQAPEGLFGGACVERAFLDMLRFKEMEIGGPLNVVEFGDPDDPFDFDYLIKYSPLQNVNKTKEYSTVLFYTTAADTRVAPSHSFKMMAQLQNTLSHNKKPFFMYLAQGAGHETSLTSRTFSIETSAIKQAILTEGLGLQRCS